jgi:single-strand DNA-binding protein
LEQRSWENESGERRSRVEVTADEVGPSLRFATVEISKTERRGPDQFDGADGSDRSGDADVVSLDA